MLILSGLINIALIGYVIYDKRKTNKSIEESHEIISRQRVLINNLIVGQHSK